MKADYKRAIIKGSGIIQGERSSITQGLTSYYTFSELDHYKNQKKLSGDRHTRADNTSISCHSIS